MKKKFELIPHTADLQIKVYAQNLEELFCNSLIGMFQSIKPQTEFKNCSYENDYLVCKNLPITHELEIKSSSLESLLVDFLSEALYLSDINDEAYLDAEIIELKDNNYLKAKIKGIKITGFEVVEIKAVTYHGLYISKKDSLWQANIVFDI